MAEKFLTLSEVAAEFGVTATTISRWVFQKLLLPAIVTPGGHKRFRRADIDKFKLANVVRHTGQLPEAPAAEETVESKIDTFLENMATTHSDLVWRPARKLRHDPNDRYRDAPARDLLQRENEARKKRIDEANKTRNEDTFLTIAGQSQSDFCDEIARTSLAAVAKRLGVAEETLRKFCRALRLRIPMTPAPTETRGRRHARSKP